MHHAGLITGTYNVLGRNSLIYHGYVNNLGIIELVFWLDTPTLVTNFRPSILLGRWLSFKHRSFIYTKPIRAYFTPS